MKLTRRKRNVMVIGKIGAGKSTVANSIILVDTFKVGNSVESVTQTAQMTQVVLRYKTGVEYDLKVIDTIGLDSHMLSNEDVMKDTKMFLKSNVPEGVHLILFAFKYRQFSPEDYDLFKSIMDLFNARDISDISALVMTRCETESAESRERIVSEFTTHERTRDIAKFMKKGVVCVGFPDLDFVDEMFKEVFKQIAQEDTERLHELIHESNVVKDIFHDETFWEPPKPCTLL